MITYKVRHFYIIFTIILIAGAGGTSLWLYKNNSEIDLISFTISLVSLTVSLMAFLIALNTFTSIDSVNKITKMDGNLLENPYYVTPLAKLIKKYHFTSLEKTENKIFEIIEWKFKKKSKTSIEFTENLQHFIDIIVFFPALFNAADIDKVSYEQKMRNILKLMNKRKDDLIAINTGNYIQITETVNLIEGVISYQNFISKNNFDGDIALLDVRGTLLRNAVTKTVYYNYLGLLYNKKAMAIIRNNLHIEGKDLFDIDTLTFIQKNCDLIKGSDRELVIMFLKESRVAFNNAISNCKEDTMWLGFIKYNDARSCFFLDLFTKEKPSSDWHIIMEEAIAARSKLNILIKEILKSKDGISHLQRHFLFQEELARLVKLNIIIAQSKLTNEFLNEPIYKGVNIYEESQSLNFHQDVQYPGLKKYQQQILVKRKRQVE